MKADVIASAYRLKLLDARRLLDDGMAEIRSDIANTGDGYAYQIARQHVATLVPRILDFCERSIPPLVRVHLDQGEGDIATIARRLQTEFLDKVLVELPGGHLYASVRGGASGLAIQSRQNDEQIFLAKKAILESSVPDRVTVVVAEAQSQALAAPFTERTRDQKFGILDSPALLKEDLGKPSGVLGRAVVYLDIDDFKAQNSRFTERVVDECILVHLQRLVTEHVQSVGYAYAEGGDEMVLLLPNSTRRMALDVAGALRRAISEYDFDVKGTSVRLSASFGVAAGADAGHDLVGRANLAKQFVKANGKNGVAVWDDGTIEICPGE
jgi:diguanylate cyclase (GGDEF)-like protein